MLGGTPGTSRIRAGPPEFVALFHRFQSRMPADRRLFEDPYAHAFLRASPRRGLHPDPVPVTGGLVIRATDRDQPGARVGIVVRTRFIDCGAFITTLADGIDQIVILVEGLDARAYRLPRA